MRATEKLKRQTSNVIEIRAGAMAEGPPLLIVGRLPKDRETIYRLAGLTELTPREAEIMLWVCEGKTDYEIGRIIHCAHRSVSGQVSRALDKLLCVNRMTAANRVRELLALPVFRNRAPAAGNGPP